MILLTGHAVQRGRERLGLGAAETRSRAQRAFDMGDTLDAFTGPTRKWIEARLRNLNCSSACVLDGFAYFFAGQDCITMIALPLPVSRAAGLTSNDADSPG